MRFTNCATSQNLIVGITIFLHKIIHKIRWISPDAKPTNQVSNLIRDTIYSTNVLNVRNYRGSKIDSDMFLLTAKLISRINTKNFHTQNESGGPAVRVELHEMNTKRNADWMESWNQSLIHKKGNEMQRSIYRSSRSRWPCCLKRRLQLLDFWDRCSKPTIRMNARFFGFFIVLVVPLRQRDHFCRGVLPGVCLIFCDL
jgi:hypothetical protein